jgi:CO/xanthine dehydrogenase FAD-binding subunit
MKAAPFDYHVAHDLRHAKELLKEFGDDVKLIAGGQSLVPMMSMRLAKPANLVDIARLSELQHFVINEKSLTLGAGVKQSFLETHLASEKVPLLKTVLPWVGHQQTRNRGTVGGSLAHADPSAELPLIAVLLNATLHCDSAENGSRSIQAKEFFQGPMWTALQVTECLTHIDWPIWQGSGIGYSFAETSIRQGDFAMASAVSQLQVDEFGKILRWNCGVGGMGGTPFQFESLTKACIGTSLTPSIIQDFSHQAIAQTDPTSDLHASSAYRKHLAIALLKKTIEDSLKMANHSIASSH